MKILLLIIFVHACAGQQEILQVLTGSTCLCRDFASDPRVCLVGRLINRCGSSVFRSLCMVTCGVCEPCESTTERGRAVSEGGTRVIRPEDCEFNCTDLAPLDQCYAISEVISDGCTRFPQSCRRTCRQCLPCAIPTPAQECTTDCHDQDSSCDFWKSEGYCEESSDFYSYTKITCPLACEVCKPCSTPPPLNTALPPTPKTCSEDCDDFDENCQFWHDEGYCNQTEEYPYLLDVCRLTCGFCTACPTEEPPCMLDCEDFNTECDYWAGEGFCDPDGAFPYTLEECPKACGVCTPCEEEDDRSTALPPTREQASNGLDEDDLY